MGLQLSTPAHRSHLCTLACSHPAGIPHRVAQASGSSAPWQALHPPAHTHQPVGSFSPFSACPSLTPPLRGTAAQLVGLSALTAESRAATATKKSEG